MMILTPPPPLRREPASAHFRALGADVDVLVTEPDRLSSTVKHVQQRFDEIDRTFSRFRSDSELARLEWLPGMRQSASALFLEVLELALRAARDTGGWFDPTVRDAVEAAGYDRDIVEVEIDGPGPVRPAGAAVHWGQITRDRDRGWVCVPAGVRLDFGGIGKGFAVDYALRTLPPEQCGVLLNAGGDLATRGEGPVGGWRIGVPPGSEESNETVVALHRGAIATSGLGRRSWCRDGVRLHHLINPRTGSPGESPWITVTVVARSCAVAEVAAKVSWLSGLDGPAWLAGLGLTGRFVTIDGRVRTVGTWPVTADTGA